MIHTLRRFSVKPATLQEIAADFAYTDAWCACCSYLVEHEGVRYLLLNDAFDGGGVEHAICRALADTDTGYLVEQIESLTTSWVEPERLPAKLVECFTHPIWVSEPFSVRCDYFLAHKCRLCA